MVIRKSVPRTTRRCSSARVSCSRRNPSIRLQRPMYGARGSWSCIAHSRSTARGTETLVRASSSCRASVARFSSRCVMTLGVEGGKPLRFVVELALRLARDAVEGVERDLSALEAPGAGDLTVDQERVDRVRRLRVEDEGPVLLRQDLRPARMDEERRVPDRQEARRRRRVGIRERRAREVEELSRSRRGTAGARSARAPGRPSRRAPPRSRRSPSCGRGRSRPGSDERAVRARPRARRRRGRSTPPRGRRDLPAAAPRFPTAGTRTRSTYAPTPRASSRPSCSSTSLRRRGPSARNRRSFLAAACIARGSASRWTRSHQALRGARIAAVNGQ